MLISAQNTEINVSRERRQLRELETGTFVTRCTTSHRGNG
jgi:hypothetical protein